ncbi:gamma-glutamyltransferase family protein [Curvibacter sp. RS43]|uniref:Gamma-glutamyltransferase family protein n=1 Tax=Curvibacter microcysteis TaxID=3026419 RepID=A0ABT5MFP6_9BURK|nr:MULTISPECIES: gamma-glutamyltransferase family protein [unclassified Curvibacter]MDD0809572.1 gamma-glutamyltransferase family protein [Curvibacter sp. RS43]MDD0814742.1 gamma-glutamyltransferase family protein [Curvibacter sp. HBC28]
MNKKVWLWALTPGVVALSLYGCGGSGSSLIVDSNAQSCSVVSSSGSPVVVGSGLAGDPAAPEAASGYRLGYKAKTSSHYMVVANTPLATKAGCDVLKAGGTAVDAAVAVQAVLGLVEPQSSTIAGSAFMVYYDADTKQVVAYDGREAAPAAATGYYLARQNQADASSPAPVPNARRSGRSIGVPGVMSMLDLAHKEHGKLAWGPLFDEGVKLATNGYKIPTRMGDAIAANAASLRLDANAVAAFFNADGTPKTSGTVTTNLPYAQSLRAIASGGAAAMYSGAMAEAIVAKAAQAVGDDTAKTPITPSLMTVADLKAYKAKKREPVCTTYRSSYYICTMAPPSSGGIAIAQSLGILENFDLSVYGPTNPANEGGIPNVMGVHLVSEAERLAYADRDKYVADTDFVPLPGNGVSSMIDKAYLKQRASLINANGKSMGTAAAGNLGDVPLGIDKTVEQGTTHFSIVDAYGNVVSMTSTVESSMGSFHMVGGFLLTNQLTDFSVLPTDTAGVLVANRVAPGKRPRSTMAPTVVFKGTAPGDFVMATGSPGGGTIIQYVLKTVIGALDWGLDAQQATSLVNIGATNSATTNVDGANTSLNLTGLIADLKAKGHTVNNAAQSSGVSTIMRVYRNGQLKLEGGVDPRREGIVLGDGAL